MKHLPNIVADPVKRLAIPVGENEYGIIVRICAKVSSHDACKCCKYYHLIPESESHCRISQKQPKLRYSCDAKIKRNEYYK